MKTEMLPADRAVRSGAGLLLLATPLLNLPTYPLNLLGTVLIATALFGWCPLYALASSVRRLFDVRRLDSHSV